MEQNKVEILEALNNEKMYSLRGDEVGKMCSPEGNDTYRKKECFRSGTGCSPFPLTVLQDCFKIMKSGRKCRKYQDKSVFPAMAFRKKRLSVKV